MIRKFWARSFVVAALFGAAMPVFAAEITSAAKQAHVTDFATGKVLFSKDADAPIFQHADYGIVATWEEALPVLQSTLSTMMA